MKLFMKAIVYVSTFFLGIFVLETYLTAIFGAY